MYRYGGDTSTSSEDDTSTAAAGAASTPTTADICRSVVRNGAKVLKCIGCGYTSDRRMNVTRHYRRIHTQLKKLRECPCGEVFQTKWEFYEHCDENHPTIRQSWYTTTHVYKLQQTKAKSKLKSVSKPGERVALSREPTRGGMATRASIRLRSREIFKSTSNDSSTPSCSSTEEVPSISSTESFSTSYSSVEEVPPLSSTESFSTSCNSENDSPLKNNQQPLDSCKSSDTNDENTVPRIAYEISHLPIKKRYSSKRRYFKDITNKNVEVQRIRPCNDSNNNTRISFRELYLSKIDEKQRAYISHIDFDELDAILKLRDMKRNFI